MTEPESLKEKWARMDSGGPLEALQRVDATQWLIDGLIAPNTINWMVASPESFKTFIALDMAASIASGRPWHGRQTRQAAVVYISAEGGDDIHVRMAAIDTATDDTSSAFKVIQARPRLDDEEGLGFLCGLLLSTDGEESNEGMGVFYYQNIVIKHLNEKERELFVALTDGYSPESFKDENGTYDLSYEHVFDLNINKWNRVCDAFNYEKWDRKLPPEKQKEHPFLKVIFDEEKGEFIQLHFVQEYLDSLYSYHRYKGYDRGYAQGTVAYHDYGRDRLIIIDTYSQTSTDDEKGTVSRFIKTLRDVQDKAKNLIKRSIGEVTFLVIDHTTKQGDSYMGSLAKLGDCDTMMKVERPRKGRFATIKCIKKRVGIPFDPIHLEFKPIEIEGFLDANGKPLQSLYVTSADDSHNSRELKEGSEETVASVILRMINESESIRLEDLRVKYIGLDSNLDKKIDTVKKAFSRAIDSLIKRKLIHENKDGFSTGGTI
jgi:hypothetical protein